MLMKKILAAVSLLLLWQGSCLALTEINDNTVVLYSLGYELGQDIKGQQLEFIKASVIHGIEDALAGKKPVFNANLRQQALASVRQQRAEKTLRSSEAFLAENAKKEGVITLPSGLQYKVISTAEGKTPAAADSVKIAFRGTLIDGREFASSHNRGEPATLNVDKVIKGLSEALQLMPTGAKWELYIPAKLAYGKRSPGKRIPANSALIYEVELLSVN